MGFWFQPEDGWLLGEGHDQAQVVGDFALFVNNATVTVRQDGEVVWRNWTGNRTEDLGPLARQYDQRQLLIHLTGASLSLQAPGSVRVASSSLDLEATGAVTTQRAQGLLAAEAGAFRFDDEPMVLRGEGRLTLSKAREAGTSGQPALSIRVLDGDDFEVAGGTPLDQAHAGLPVAGSPGWVVGGLLLALLAGVAAVGYGTGAFEGAVAGVRERRYTKWMTRGREMAGGRDFEAAAQCFRRATRADPRKASAWFHLSLATLETGDYERTLAVVDEIRETAPVFDPLDLMEVEIEAAYEHGDLDRCRRALENLLDKSHEMGAGLAADLGLDRDELGPELANRIAPEDEPGGLPGYV